MAAGAPNSLLFFLCLNDRGGAELSMLTLARALMQRGCRVTLAVYGGQPGLARACGFEGQVVDLNALRTLAAIGPLAALLRRLRPSVVIGALPYTNLAAGLALFLASPFGMRRPRLIVTEHGIEGMTACEKSWSFAMLTRFIYGHAFAVVAVSHRLAQRWRILLPRSARVTVIYNPVVPDIPVTPALPAHVWLADKTLPVIMGVGRLKPEKNFALLIRAFVLAAAQKPMRLIILGQGEQRSMLEALIQALDAADKILLPGFADPVGAWLPYADLFVSASQREGFGNAIVEALAQGVPVVATDCPYGPAEILQEGLYGILTPVNDADALAQAMIDALNSTENKAMLRKRAADFTVARCVDGYSALIDNTLPVQE